MCNSLWPPGCSPPVSSVHGISKARILEWLAIPFSRGSSWPRNWTCVSLIGRQILYHLATISSAKSEALSTGRRARAIAIHQVWTPVPKSTMISSQPRIPAKSWGGDSPKLNFNKYWHSFHERMCFPTFRLFSLKTYPILSLAKDSFGLMFLIGIILSTEGFANIYMVNLVHNIVILPPHVLLASRNSYEIFPPEYIKLTPLAFKQFQLKSATHYARFLNLENYYFQRDF